MTSSLQSTPSACAHQVGDQVGHGPHVHDSDLVRSCYDGHHKYVCGERVRAPKGDPGFLKPTWCRPRFNSRPDGIRTAGPADS